MINDKDVSLLNVTYIRPGKDKYTGEKIQERFEVIYKDSNGNVHKKDEPAEADIFIVKPEYRNYNYNKPVERIDHCDVVRVPISKIKFKIAEAMGEQGEAFVKDCIANKNFKALDRLYGWPYSYVADFQPEYYYMRDWYKNHELKEPKLTKAYMDIEIDQIDNKIDINNIKNSAIAPVNCVTVILEESRECYTFILKPFPPPLISSGEYNEDYRKELYESQLKQWKYLMDHKKEFIKEQHEAFDKVYGKFDYHIRSYDKEIELIADIFRLINDRKPNYLMCWNARFDIQYLMYRIINLGYDPVSIICHPDFKNPRCYFQEDNRTFEISKQTDYFNCSSYTQYVCQMRNFSNVRKSEHKLRSFSLNAISDRELKDKKVDYADIGNIITFPYIDYWRFLAYNVKDSMLQYGIEKKNNDIATYYMRSHENLTPYNKIFKETHLLRNVREKYFEDGGWVQGNNINIISKDNDNEFYESSDERNNESYDGAINADPIWNDNIGVDLMGKNSNNLYSNCIDFDMSSFYPSNKIFSNMDPITLIYKASLDNNDFLSGEINNRSLNTDYIKKDKNGNEKTTDFTGEALNAVLGENILTVGFNYLNLPSITELTDRVIKELKK